MSPSSIFSFNTLQFRPHFPRAIGLAFLILLVAEIGIRQGLERGVLPPPLDLDRTIAGYVDGLKESDPELWLLGNSTLYYGVDVHAMAKASGKDAIALSHGSATLAGSAAMLAYYLEQGLTKPSHVILAVSTDDLNASGHRAMLSKRYMGYTPEPIENLGDLLAIRYAAYSVKTWVTASINRAAGASVERRFSGDLKVSDERLLHKLAEDFTFDASAFKRLAELRTLYELDRITVLLLPCTDVYSNYHDALVPKFTYREVRTTLAKACRESGVQFVDLGEPSADYELFSDSYHLNERGRAYLTPLLLERLFVQAL